MFAPRFNALSIAFDTSIHIVRICIEKKLYYGKIRHTNQLECFHTQPQRASKVYIYV